MHFEPYPFEKLNTLLQGLTPNPEYDFIALTIGEPQFETPDFLQQTLKDNTRLLNKYPKSSGEAVLKEAQACFVEKRFGITLLPEQMIPTFGTREVLFNFPQFLLFDKEKPVMAFTNPFYQIYEGAAIASRAKTIYLNLNESNGFKPDPQDSRLKEADLVILNFPNNPTASVLSKTEMVDWVESSIENGYVLLNDECYSEIYSGEKPPSLLEASIDAGNASFENILVINSISKRSSAPGLRSGFIAGDAKLLEEYMLYRTYVGCAIPLPIQMAAAEAWKDMDHAEGIRKRYVKNMQIAKEILGVDVSEATFYLWLQVGDEEKATRDLYEHYNVKVLPGSYLGREGAGKGYVRIALVEEEHKTRDALQRIKDYLKGDR